MVGDRYYDTIGVKQNGKFLTQPVEWQTVPITISANGTMSADRSINLSPKTAEIVKTLLVKEGDRVTQGQVIAVMDDSNLRGQLAQQAANLQRLQAGNRREDIAKAEAQVAEARANLQQLKSGNRPQDIA